MQIWIDTEQVETSDTIEQALDTARAHAEQTGRLIVEINADGKPLDDSLFENPAASTPDIAELRFVTVDPIAFMNQTLDDTRLSLESTKAEQIVVASQIQSGELSNAIELLGPVLEGWHAVRDVVDQLSALAGVDLHTLDIDGVSATECINGLAKALGEIRDALANEDWSSMGDLLEYNLDEQASTWMSLIDALQHTISKGSS